MNKIVKTFKIFSAAAFVAFFSVSTAFAQEAAITDEKLEAYVMVMDSVDALRAQLSEDVSTMIKEHELMDGGRIFNEIKSANGDSEKLTELGITPEQVSAYNEIENEMAERTNNLNSTFSEMVKEHIGISEYKSIKKGIKSDEELKERYEALLAERGETEDAAVVEEEAAETEAGSGEAATDENLSQQ